jgi:hypothetical protein
MHYRIPERHRFRQRTRVWDRTAPNFDDTFLQLEALLAGVPDERFNVMWSRYGALPESFPAETTRLAQDIARDAESPYAKALALSQWLGAHSAYSLGPVAPPAGEDFVTHFIGTGEGHCVYYASALAAMARCVGIPSRYVVGFALERQGENLFKATGATAHAWTELYFNGIGWLEMDPLLWDAEEPLNRGLIRSSTGLGGTVIMMPPERPEPEFGTSAALSLGPRGEPLPPELRVTLLLAGIAAVIIAWRAGIRLALTRQARRFALGRVCRKTKGAFPALDTYCKDIAKQLALLGLRPLPGETLRVFSARADRLIVLEGAAYSPVAEALSDYWFAGKAPAKEQIEAACRYHGALEARLLQVLGKWPYIAKRGLR